VDRESMQQFWDERAKEDAFYFVDNRIAYRDPAQEARFWAGGVEDLDLLLRLSEIEVKPADRVVEIGCGVGRLTRVLSERAASVKALDVSAEMLQQAGEHNGHLDNVEWVHGDGLSLTGIPDGEADLVVSHVVFQHIPDPQITLGYVREMGRVLKPGGVAGFQVSNDSTVHRASAGLVDKLRAALGRAPKGQTHAAWVGSAVELDDLRAAAADGGLDVEKLVGEGTQYMLVRLRKQTLK
jgi:SAM-dependent methyltransferase